MKDFGGVLTMDEFWAMASEPGHDWYALTQAEPPDTDSGDGDLVGLD